MFTKVRPTAKEMSMAIVCLLLVLGGAFIAAQLTLYREPPLFSLSPPCLELPCNRLRVAGWHLGDGLQVAKSAEQK